MLTRNVDAKFRMPFLRRNKTALQVGVNLFTCTLKPRTIYCAYTYSILFLLKPTVTVWHNETGKLMLDSTSFRRTVRDFLGPGS